MSLSHCPCHSVISILTLSLKATVAVAATHLVPGLLARLLLLLPVNNLHCCHTCVCVCVCVCV
jgi:hypothetical protein